MNASSFLRPSQITEKKASDAAMALTLLCLLVAMSTGKAWALQLGAAILVLAMLAPLTFRYPAVVWFGLSHVLGSVSSRIVLTLLFFLLVVPVGLWRRARGRDPLQLRAFRKHDRSLFLQRNQRFSRADLLHPF